MLVTFSPPIPLDPKYIVRKVNRKVLYEVNVLQVF